MDKARFKKWGIVALSVVCIASVSLNAMNWFHSEQLRQDGMFVMWHSLDDFSRAFSSLYGVVERGENIFESDYWINFGDSHSAMINSTFALVAHDVFWRGRHSDFIRLPTSIFIHTHDLIEDDDTERLLDFISRRHVDLEELLSNLSTEVDANGIMVTSANTNMSNRQILRYFKMVSDSVWEQQQELHIRRGEERRLEQIREQLGIVP